MALLLHLLILGTLLSLTVALRLARRDYYQNDMAEVVEHASEARALELQTGWKSHHYSQLGSESAQAAIVQRIHENESGLTEMQRAKLDKRVLELLRFLAHPDFEAYYRLRTEGFRYEFTPDALGSSLLASAKHQARPETASPEKEILRLLWNGAHQTAGGAVRSKVTAIALDSLKASVSHTNSGKALVVGPVRQGFTVAAEVPNPGFHYNNSPGSVPLLFEFSFLAKVDDSMVTGPLHVSLLWVEQDQNWALNRLIADSWLRFRTLF